MFDIQSLANEVASQAWATSEDAHLNEWIKAAVLMTQGTNRKILDIEERSDFPSSQFPQGMRWFFVESEHLIQEGHRCFYADSVFYLDGCCVVLNTKDLCDGKLSSVPRLLMEHRNAK